MKITFTQPEPKFVPFTSLDELFAALGDRNIEIWLHVGNREFTLVADYLKPGFAQGMLYSDFADYGIMLPVPEPKIGYQYRSSNMSECVIESTPYLQIWCGRIFETKEGAKAGWGELSDGDELVEVPYWEVEE